MSVLDGLYRHLGTSVVWDDVGVTFTRRDTASHVDWDHVHGVRQIGKPGFVQLLVRGHVPPPDLRTDPFSVAVASEADANRLVTSIAWRATPVRGI